MRYTRSIPSESQYLTSTAVIMGEIMKVVVSSLLILRSGDQLGAIFSNPTELMKTGVPAFLYLIQNNLQYIAVSNMNAATYQVTYQLKILSTAMMSVLILNKSISGTKWLALGILTAGVAAVQISGMPSGHAAAAPQPNIDMSVGFAATIAACCCSGLAGVYFEKILKKSEVSLWTRNVQLGLYSIAIGLVGYRYELSGMAEGARPAGGFLHGYTGLTWANIAVQSCGGLIIAVVIKFADNILKNFATAISIILSAFVSWLFMGFQLSWLFVLGVALVNYAVYLYGQPAPPAPKTTLAEPMQPLFQNRV